jgi:hypothetical protein
MRVRALLSVGAAAGVLVAGAEAASEPRLTLADRSPVVLAGAGFEPRQRVVVTVRAPSLVVHRTVTANERGRFRTSISALRLTGRLRCANGVTIVARPERGSLLLWHPPRLPDCAAPPLVPG